MRVTIGCQGLRGERGGAWSLLGGTSYGCSIVLCRRFESLLYFLSFWSSFVQTENSGDPMPRLGAVDRFTGERWGKGHSLWHFHWCVLRPGSSQVITFFVVCLF